MLFTRLKQKIADSLIFTANDGRVVFYPFGPLKGYLLPKTTFEPLITKSIVWFNDMSLHLKPPFDKLS